MTGNDRTFGRAGFEVEFHRAVMRNEVGEYLNVECGVYLDGTVGAGGMTEMILEKIRQGLVIGIDLDTDALDFARQRLGLRDNLRLVHGNFAAMASLVQEFPEARAGLAGVVLDLGVSRHQVVSDSGMSYNVDAPLDMRFDRSGNTPTARELIRRSPETELVRIISEYGEERFTRRISRRLHELRHRIETTHDLAELVRSVVPMRFQAKSVVNVFRALRMAVNDELGNLQRGLEQAIDLLANNGRIVVLSYHSGEDRLVKQAFRAGAERGVLEILTRKPQRPSDDEVAANPSARSARLRAARKTGVKPEGNLQ